MNIKINSTVRSSPTVQSGRPDFLTQYTLTREFNSWCWINGEPILAMMGYVDTLIEMEFLEEGIMEYGRS